MLRVNERQRKYYEHTGGTNRTPRNSIATNLWRSARRRIYSVRPDITSLHRDWMGDVSGCDVLDLGVGEGNTLSAHLARNAQRYVAIDLSQSRLAAFRKKLEGQGIAGARLHAVDFLSDDFTETGFDLIYAKAVMHHFRHLPTFLDALDSKLVRGGRAVTHDPLETWLPAKLVRRAYRRWQTDAEWEHPLSSTGLATIQDQFTLERVQGIYGKSKWAIPLSIISPDLAARKSAAWHRDDALRCTDLGGVGACLQISMMFRTTSASR